MVSTPTDQPASNTDPESAPTFPDEMEAERAGYESRRRNRRCRIVGALTTATISILIILATVTLTRNGGEQKPQKSQKGVSMESHPTDSPTGIPWIQLGGDMDGSYPMDFMGISVALSNDGRRVAVGASGNDFPDIGILPANTSFKNMHYSHGHVRVFERSSENDAWAQMGTDIIAPIVAPDGDDDSAFVGLPYDLMGSAVAISADGSFIAAGAPLSNGGEGNVFCFKYNGTDWIQRGTAISGNAFGQDLFDVSRYLALDDEGSIIAVGEPGHGSGSGRIRVYRWNETEMEWEKMGNSIYSRGVLDKFGFSVDLSGDGKRLVAGAPFHDRNGEDTSEELVQDSGHVRVYDFDDENEKWIQKGADIFLETENGTSLPGALFGRSVSISHDGNIVAVGAPKSITNVDEADGQLAGSVGVYKLNDNEENWVLVGELIDDHHSYYLGWDVSLSDDGSRVAFSAIGLQRFGKVFLQSKVIVCGYVSDGDSARWKQIGEDIVDGHLVRSDGMQILDWTGYSIDVSGNGQIIGVGSPMQLNEEKTITGHTRVYHDPFVHEE